jgi:hypothetical protein
MNTDAGQVTQDDITIESNHETADQIQLAFADVPSPPSSPDDAPPAESTEKAPAAVEDATGTPYTESDSSDLTEKKSKANRRNNPTEAVKSAIAKQREAERRADAAEARIQQMAAPPPPAEPPPQPDWERFKSLPGVPTVDQFTSYEDYSIAMATFIADVRYQQRDEEKSAVHEAHRQREAESVQMAQWHKKLEDARAADSHFDDDLNLETPMSLPMQHLTMNSPHSAAILKWLSANPQESQRISTLHPAETYREMGKIEARLEAAPARASARVVSNAKPPIRPLGTSPHVADEFAITDDLSFDEHFRRANAADRARGRL